MAQYRLKPVIEAVQWDNRDATAWWLEAANRGVVWRRAERLDELVIKTLGGEVSASEGDWIIRGVAGELEACKPDIFEATYERVDEPEASR